MQKIFALPNIRLWFKDRVLVGLLKNAGTLLSGDIFASALGLVSIAITARVLGPEKFGILVLIQTYVAIIDRLFNFQSWQALIKYGAEHLDRNEEERLKGLIRFGSLLDAGSAIVATIVAFSAVYWVGKYKGWSLPTIQMTMLYSGSILFHLSGTPTAILRLFDRFKLFAVQQITASSFKLVGVIVAFMFNWGLLGFVWIWMLTDVLGNLILLIMGWRELVRKKLFGWWKIEYERWREIFSFTWWTNVTATLDLPVRQMDMFIVAAVVSIEAVGLYKIFKQVSLILTKVADPIYQAIFPQVSRLIAQSNLRSAAKISAKTGALLLTISLPVSIMVSLFSPVWMSLAFGQSYNREILSLGLFLIFTALSLGFITIHPLFIALGFVKHNVIILAFSNACYIAAAWILCHRFGLIGIVLAFGFQFSLVILAKLLIISSKFRSGKI